MLETYGREEFYKGIWIDFNDYGHNEYSVQIDSGDDYMFATIEEARKFINELLEELKAE